MKWQNHIGLDIGSSTIKLVQLSPSGAGRFRLVALGQVGTPSFDEATSWDKSRSEAIKALIKEANCSTKQVVVSLPDTQVYTRVIEMPVMTEADLSSTIRFQAEQYIPVPLTDVVLKHQILAVPEQGVPGAKMSVLLVASPNDVLSRYTLMMTNASLDVIAIETEILSVARVIVGADGPNSPVSLVAHLGAESTSLAIFKGGLLVMVQVVNVGAAAVVRSVTSQLGLDFRQALEYVRAYGLEESKLEGKVATAVKPVVEQIASEIRRMVAFYQTRETTGLVKRVVLTGGMAMLPGLVEFLVNAVSLEVETGNPFAQVDLSGAQMKEIGEDGPIFAAAVGLAMKLT